MQYYIIRNIGDLPVIESTDNDDVFESEGKFFVKETYTDIDNEIRECEVRVYPTKREAWRVAIGRLDDHISHMQKIRDEAFHKALDEGAFKQTPEEFNKWVDGIKGEPSSNLFEARNKVK